MNIPSYCMNFMSYASYRHILRKCSNFDQKNKIPLALGIKNCGFQLKMVGTGSQNEKVCKMEKSKLLTTLTRRSTGLGSVNRSFGFMDIKRLPRFIFYTVFLHFFRVFLVLASRDWFECVLDWLTWFCKSFEDFEG